MIKNCKKIIINRLRISATCVIATCFLQLITHRWCFAVQTNNLPTVQLKRKGSFHVIAIDPDKQTDTFLKKLSKNAGASFSRVRLSQPKSNPNLIQSRHKQKKVEPKPRKQNKAIILSAILFFIIILFELAALLYFWSKKKNKQHAVAAASRITIGVKYKGFSSKWTSFTKKELLIGRLPKCDLRVNDDEVSREHMLLYLRNGSWFARHLSLTNPTLIWQHEKQALSRITTVKIVGQTVFKIGSTKIIVVPEHGSP